MSRPVKCAVPADPDAASAAPRHDAVLWGTTIAGRPFRPSDWAERLAGLTSAFGAERKLAYSPLVCPVDVRGSHALIVSHALADLEPRLYQFLLNFARDNALVVTWEANAIDAPRQLEPPPGVAVHGEPREPV
jgi:hypothetical protein